MSYPLVSVIIPVYQAENFVTECIRSVQAQNYPELEIILVDDGATDSSGELCDQLAKKDDRIIVIHKKNGGLSDARNAGIDASRGEYLSFIDSDDFIHPMFMEVLLQLCETTQCNISKCGMQEVEGDTFVSEGEKEDTYKLYSAEEYLEKINRVNAGFSVCNKLFHRELFSTIKFPYAKLHEDVAVIYKLIAMSKKIVEVEYKLYFYYKNPKSITKSIIKKERLDDIEFRMNMYSFCKKKKWNVAARAQADYILNMIRMYQKIDKENVDNYKEFIKRLKNIKYEFAMRIVKKEYTCVKEKLMIYINLLLNN